MLFMHKECKPQFCLCITESPYFFARCKISPSSRHEGKSCYRVVMVRGLLFLRSERVKNESHPFSCLGKSYLLWVKWSFLEYFEVNKGGDDNNIFAGWRKKVTCIQRTWEYICKSVFMMCLESSVTEQADKIFSLTPYPSIIRHYLHFHSLIPLTVIEYIGFQSVNPIFTRTHLSAHYSTLPDISRNDEWCCNICVSSYASTPWMTNSSSLTFFLQ